MDKIERRRAIEGATRDANILIANGFLDHGEEWIRAWYSYDLKWSTGEDSYLTIPAKNVGPFIESARQIPVVFELAKFFTGTRLLLGAPIPEEIRMLVAEHLKGELPVPPGKKGRKTNWGRDFIIINTMRKLLLAYEMTPTGNRHVLGSRERKGNASEVMKEALASTRIGHLDVQRIQKIWGSKMSQSRHDEAYGLYLTSMFDDEPELERV